MRNQIYLGSERFVARMQLRIPVDADLAEMPRMQRQPSAKPLAYYRSRTDDPQQGMALAYRSGDYSLKVIAEHFGFHYSTVSRAVKRYEENDERL